MNSNRHCLNYTGTEEQNRRGTLLLEATKQFCNERQHNKPDAANQFKQLFYSLINETSVEMRKLISSRLARNPFTPRTVAYCLAMDVLEVAAPFLLISPVLWEKDLLQLVEKLDVSYLSIVARRSDVTPRIAQALTNRGDKLTCQILIRNPVLNLNRIQSVQSQSDKISSVPKTQDSIANPKSSAELLELANASGKIGRKNTPSVDHSDQSKTIFHRLMAHAKSGSTTQFAQVISDAIDMPLYGIEKIVRHKNSSSLAIFLRGMNFSRAEASQIIIANNNQAAKNISGLTDLMEQFSRRTVAQCQQIMRELGAKKQFLKSDHRPVQDVEAKIENAVANRRQVILTKAPRLFGDRRKTG